MAPKAQKGVPVGVDEKTLTAENFEKELQALAAKAREETTFRSVMRSVAVAFQAAQILACAAVYSNLSQLALAPVYGSIPASIWHSSLVVTACLLGWSLNLRLQKLLPRKPIFFLASIAAYIPMLQYFLLQLSSYLGPIYGPPLTETLTYVPLLVFSASAVAEILEDLDLSALPNTVAEAVPGIGSFFFFRAVERFSMPFIVNNIGASLLQSRVGLQLVVSGILARIAPSNVLLFALPALFHAAFLNPHVQTSFATFDMNMKMERDLGWKVLARTDSVTGYISVLENTRAKYRALRCDHSLLGGMWLKSDKVTMSESIFGVFNMLEAVRLVEVPQSPDPWSTNALVMYVPFPQFQTLSNGNFSGLGIGTTPSALISHGINTTIVEIDPKVHSYAVEYFSLPENHTPVIADAVQYTASLASSNSQPRFNYIIHDVFTGGAEPVALFTTEFFSNLHKIMKPNGVIAINYAGDLLLPSARLVVNTILATFPTCRVYRELPSPTPAEIESQGGDFTNMVIFCTLVAKKPLTFRKPVEADFLSSFTRRQFLLPEHEIPLKEFEWREGEDTRVLSKDDTGRLEGWHRTSAVGHWGVMRGVVPSGVWENW
jgi:hypothetical protein